MIAVQLKGGLGNQLFQYALGRRLSLIHQTDLIFDLSFLANRVPGKNKTFYDYDLGLFNLPARVATPADLPQYGRRFSTRNRLVRGWHLLRMQSAGFRYIRERGFQFEPKILQLPADIYLDGYWQSERYFKDVSPQIRQELRFHVELSAKAAAMLQFMQQTNSVCVHIRRGDYLKILGITGVVGADYIHAGVKYLAERFAGLHFFVFSNDPLWCIENLKIDYPHTFITSDNAGNNDKEHFVLMSSAMHFVIANSTYSWWAAWLAQNPDKVVIGPQRWAQDPRLNTKDVLPAEWLRM